jgi:hypothetical protein
MEEAAFFWLSFAIFVYFVFYAVTTFGLICRSLYETVLTGVERGRLFTPPERRYRPGISLIAPAYNMAPIIAASARALLAADYDPLEVVIVDDGSEDGTTAALDAAFDLVELPVGDRMKIPDCSALLRQPQRPCVSYRRKRRPFGCDQRQLERCPPGTSRVVDADTLPNGTLKRIARCSPPTRTMVRPAAASGRRGGDREQRGRGHVFPGGTEATQTASTQLPRRAVAWSSMNGLMIISGAFGVFRRDLVRDGGGLSLQTLGEDMEL